MDDYAIREMDVKIRKGIDDAMAAAKRVLGKEYPLDYVNIVVEVAPGELPIYQRTVCSARGLLAILSAALTANPKA